jgi:uncharacterized protein (TIGR02996 family)
MTSDESALLAAVRAAPEQDLPRLVYADWLDDQGQPERAEFIRVQCEFPRLTDLDRRCPYLNSSGKGKPRWEVGECRCAGCRVTRREQEIWAGFGKPYERARAFGLPANWLVFLSAETQWVSAGYAPSDGAAVVRRGFVADLICPAAAWVRHGDALLAREPVRRVVLTTDVDVSWATDADWRRAFRTARVSRQGYEGGDDPQFRRVHLALYRSRWPGVRFELVQGGWTVATSSTPRDDLNAMIRRLTAATVYPPST